MRKLFAALITITLLAGALAGCSGGSPSAGPNDTGAASASSGAANAATQAEVPKEDIKVAFLIPGLLGDKSFFDATNAAAELVRSSLGIECKVVEMGTDQTKWYPTYVDYCEQDYDILITVSATINDVLMEIAEEYPNQALINAACSAEMDVPKSLYVMANDEGALGYLAGIAAALKAGELGDTCIGFIGGMDIPGINQMLVGYIDGAQYVNPDLKVTYSYVGGFSDPGKAKETALVMYNDVSIIWQAAGASGLGVFDAAKEMTQKGSPRFAIGVDSDQAAELRDSDPAMADVILTSAVKKIPEATLEAVASYMRGEVNFGTQEIVGLEADALGLAKDENYHKYLSETSRNKVEEIEAKIISGEIQPIETRGMSTDEVERIRTAARP